MVVRLHIRHQFLSLDCKRAFHGIGLSLLIDLDHIQSNACMGFGEKGNANSSEA